MKKITWNEFTNLANAFYMRILDIDIVVNCEITDDNEVEFLADMRFENGKADFCSYDNYFYYITEKDNKKILYDPNNGSMKVKIQDQSEITILFLQPIKDVKGLLKEKWMLQDI